MPCSRTWPYGKWTSRVLPTLRERADRCRGPRRRRVPQADRGAEEGPLRLLEGVRGAQPPVLRRAIDRVRRRPGEEAMTDPLVGKRFRSLIVDREEDEEYGEVTHPVGSTFT